MTTLLLWVTFLEANGIDVTDERVFLFCLNPGFILKFGKCKNEDGARSEPDTSPFVALLTILM